MYRRSAPSRNGFTPFKSPMLVKRATIEDQVASTTDSLLQKRALTPTVANVQKKAKTDHENKSGEPMQKSYVVLWRKKTTKKHKSWDGEGLMIVHENGTATFRCDTTGGDNYREEGRSLSKVNVDGIISLGGFDLEVDYEVTDPTELAKFAKYTQKSSSSRSVVSVIPAEPRTIIKKLEIPAKRESIPLYTNFKPVVPKGSNLKRSNREPLYDPGAEGALVMPRPPSIDELKIRDVVVDPVISRTLREHQREGLIFLYECVMGFRDFGGNGALLADEMGLGKTLMTIALIWTLLRQTPLEDTPPVKKVLIACPVTLIGNWRKEFKKWLGTQKVSVLTINGKNTVKQDKSAILSFGKTRVYQVLIMGYEKIQSMSTELETVNFDLLVCDEGHRLKSGLSKTMKILNSLDIEKRVLLTGTPIQNDLNEFYNIINFINPGVLGTLSKFQRDFIKPILRAREINCKSKSVIEMGDEKSNELIEITRNFVLRRTNDLLHDFLPPKTDIILFTPPTKLQLSLFNVITHSKQYNLALTKSGYNESLSLIMTMRKICNSPSLVSDENLFKEVTAAGGNPLDLSKKVASGKIKILIHLLSQIRKLDEKVVLISNFTQTLDVLEAIIKPQGFSFLRLDGSTPNKSRDKIVSDFNNSSVDSSFIFLLSAKSGGVGLNLIGASRLILFDNDWNPAIDLQAMARIHRDGQKKPVFIYRLLTTGTIDEKIFQRQLMKNNLSDKFLDGKNDSKDDLFDYNDLKDLFSIDVSTKSNTHGLLECDCPGIGDIMEDTTEEEEEEVPTENEEESWMSALDFKQLSQDPTKKRNAIKHCLVDYKHIDPLNCDSYEDDVLSNILQEDKNKELVSYMFSKVNKRLEMI